MCDLLGADLLMMGVHDDTVFFPGLVVGQNGVHRGEWLWYMSNVDDSCQKPMIPVQPCQPMGTAKHLLVNRHSVQACHSVQV